jgi:hypothetical protein
MYVKNLSAMFDEGAIDHENHTVKGTFTDDNVDEHGHMIDRSAMEAAIAEYRAWSNVRDMHGKPVGVAESVGELTWNTIVAKIFDDEVWKMIVNKVYKGFSIGAMVTNGKMMKVSEIAEEKFAGISGAMRGAIKRAGEVFVITELTLVEVSVVDRPANPRALFAKSVDGMEVMALPSVTKQSGVDAIKSAIIDKTDDGDGFVADPVEETVTEESMEDVQEEVVDAVDNTEVAEVEVEKFLDANEPDVVEPEVYEVEFTEVVVAEEVAEIVDEPVAEVSKLIDAVSLLTNVVNKLIAEVAAISTASTKELAIDDEQMSKLADMVSEKVVVRRKSAVYGTGEDADEEPKRIDLKALRVSDLSDLIVNSVARRAVK